MCQPRTIAEIDVSKAVRAKCREKCDCLCWFSQTMHTHPEVSEAGHDTELHGAGAVKIKVLRFAVRTASRKSGASCRKICHCSRKVIWTTFGSSYTYVQSIVSQGWTDRRSVRCRIQANLVAVVPPANVGQAHARPSCRYCTATSLRTRSILSAQTVADHWAKSVDVKTLFVACECICARSNLYYDIRRYLPSRERHTVVRK